MHRIVCAALLLASACALAENATTPGEVTSPYPTIVHLAIDWKIAGDDNLNAACAVRFRETGAKDWREGLPLRRVPAGKSQGTTPIFSWENRLSGSLFDLKPNTEYEIELKLSDPDGGNAEKTLKARTRPVPRIGPNCEIHELPAGNHDRLDVQDGTPEKPSAYISRDGQAVYKSVNLANHKWVYVEGVTIKNLDGNHTKGVVLNGASNCMVRRCKINTVYGIVAYKPGMANCYIADNEITGIYGWDEKLMGANGKTNGEGIEITGSGNVIVFNKVSGFRDCLSHMEDDGTADQNCNDWMNNDVYLGLDDGMEADFAMSNCRIVRNRFTNCFMGLSSQPGLGGPTYFIRNVMYNLTHAPFKLYRFSRGDVVLHNTVVKTGDGMGCFTSDTPDFLYFRNNLCIGGSTGGRKWGGYVPGEGHAAGVNALGPHCDLDFDALGTFQTPFIGAIGKQRFNSQDEMRKGPQETHGLKIDMSVFKDVAFPEKPETEYKPPDLRPAPGSAAVDAAQRLPNINDDCLGAGPDIGAYEAGQELPHFGPRPEGVDEETEYLKRASGKTASNKSDGGDNKSADLAQAAKAAPAIDPAPHRDSLSKAFGGDGVKKGTKVFMKVMGQGQEVAFKGVDDSGIKVDVSGNTLPVRWKDVANEDLAQMAMRLLPDDAEALFHAGALAASEKNDALAQKIADRLSELKSGKAKELDALRGSHR